MKRILFILFLFPVFIRAQTIIRFAGNDTVGYSGDGSPATAAKFSYPNFVRSDGSGNIFIADWNNYRVRKINTANIITTIAGNGFAGYTGDGGPATLAEINPISVALDSSGNIFIGEDSFARYGISCVRKVDFTGRITTFAGGVRGYGGDGGPATAAGFQDVADVAVDNAGNVYIVDYIDNRVRKVNTDGIISTIAGTGTFGSIGDGGPATLAKFNEPVGIALDKRGDIYIADFFNYKVRKIDEFGIITTFAGNGVQGFSGDSGPATAAQLSKPQGLAVDDYGNVYIADFGNDRIRIVNTSGIISTFAGNGTTGNRGDGGPCLLAEFSKPCGICVDKTGNIFVSDAANNNIRKIFGDYSGVTVQKSRIEGVYIYPNPASNTLFVSMTERIFQISIINLIGQTKYTRTSNAETVQINIADLEPGVYFIKINNTEVRKFVKE